MRALLAPALAAAFAACAPGLPARADEISQAVAFTSAEATDRLTVTLLDAEAKDGVALFVVRDKDGWPVYADAAALSAPSWDDPVEAWTAEAARDRLGFQSDPLSRYDADLVAREDAGVGAFWPVDESDALERARAADRPLLCYPNAPGGYTCAWWDDMSGRGVALIEGAS